MGPRKAKKPTDRTRCHAKLLENQLSVEVANMLDEFIRNGKIQLVDLDEEALRILRESPTEASVNALKKLCKLNFDRRSIVSALLSTMVELCTLKQASLSTTNMNSATVLEGSQTNQPRKIRSDGDVQPEQSLPSSTNSIHAIPEERLQANQSHENVLENGDGSFNPEFKSKLNPAAAEFVPRAVQKRSVEVTSNTEIIPTVKTEKDRTRPTGTDNRTSNGYYYNNFNQYERGYGRQQKFRPEYRYYVWRRQGNSFINTAPEVPKSQICCLHFADKCPIPKSLEYFDEVFLDRPTSNYVMH